MLVFGLGTQVASVEPPELRTAVVQAACEILDIKKEMELE